MIKNLMLSLAILTFACSCSDYDWDKPDSKANRAGFESHFGFKPQKDVTNVYFFADEWGGDASYWFAFSAPREVIDKIIQKWKLTSVEKNSDNYTPPVTEALVWWNLEERKKSLRYEFRDEAKEIECHLWYDPETQKCQVVIIYY